MKLTIATKALRDAVDRLARIPGSHGAAPHTQAIQMTGDMAGLTLMRFTSEAKISITLDDVEIAEEFTDFRVGHSSFSNLLDRLPGKNTVLTRDKTHLLITDGAVKSKLAIFTEDEAAEPPEQEMETDTINLPIEDLKSLFSWPVEAASKDSNRPQLGGVCLRMIEDKLCFIGTDGRRLHMIREDWKLPVDVVIPAVGIDTILRVCAPESGACQFSVGENMVSVVSANVEVCVTLIAEKMPNIAPYLSPDESSIKSKITINRDEFVPALEACAPVGYGDSKLVKVALTKKKLTLSGASGDSETSVGLECFASDPLNFGVASIQLANALKHVDVDDKGDVEFMVCGGFLLIKQPRKLAFIGLADETKLK